jgi:type IV secretory pathway VirB2 component (pilin)
MFSTNLFVRPNRTSVFITVLGILALMVLLTSNAHATAATGGGLPYEDWLTKIRASITGPVAFTISIVAIVAAGAMLIFGGDMNGFLKTLVFIVLVLAFIIGAQNTISAITGTGAVIAGVTPCFAGVSQPMHS